MIFSLDFFCPSTGLYSRLSFFLSFFFFLRFYLFIFRERGREREREGEKHQLTASDRVPLARVQYGDQTNPSVWLDQELTQDLLLHWMTPSQLSHTSQGFLLPFSEASKEAWKRPHWSQSTLHLVLAFSLQHNQPVVFQGLFECRKQQDACDLTAWLSSS